MDLSFLLLINLLFPENAEFSLLLILPKCPLYGLFFCCHLPSSPSDHKDHYWHSTKSVLEKNKWNSQPFSTRPMLDHLPIFEFFQFLESRLSPKMCYFLTGSVTKFTDYSRFKRKGSVVTAWEDHGHIWCGGSVCHVVQANKKKKKMWFLCGSLSQWEMIWSSQTHLSPALWP